PCRGLRRGVPVPASGPCLLWPATTGDPPAHRKAALPTHERSAGRWRCPNPTKCRCGWIAVSASLDDTRPPPRRDCLACGAVVRIATPSDRELRAIVLPGPRMRRAARDLTP